MPADIPKVVFPDPVAQRRPGAAYVCPLVRGQTIWVVLASGFGDYEILEARFDEHQPGWGKGHALYTARIPGSEGTSWRSSMRETFGTEREARVAEAAYHRRYAQRKRKEAQASDQQAEAAEARILALDAEAAARRGAAEVCS
jgi:hypothetical protein